MEQRLFDPESPPEWLDSSWWADTPNCDHLAHPAGVHTARINAVAALAFELFQLGFVDTAVDMGAGDGAVLWKLCGLAPDVIAHRAWGYEIIKDSVRVARDERGVDVREGHVTEGYSDIRGVRRPLQWADLVICTEMLEHLADPHAWARTMATNVEMKAGPGRHGTGGWLIASSPWNETEYRHEHNHAWCWDMRGYKEMLTAAGWYVVEIQQVEWSQVVLACRRPTDAERLEDARAGTLTLTTDEAIAALEDEREAWPANIEPNAIAKSVWVP